MVQENNGTKFPSHFAPRSVKEDKAWCKQYAEAFHTESGYKPTDSALTRTNKNYSRMRAYGKGEQSQLQYKELMGLKKEKGGEPTNGSFRNINFEILKVAPKIRNVVVNKIVNHPLKMTAKPIDPQGISDRRKFKSKLLEFIVNKEQIERFEMLTKLGLERPVPPGEVPPGNLLEVDPYMDMHPRDTMSMEVLDFLKLSFHENDWNQLGREVAGDIFDLGVGGTVQYIDVDGKIKFRRADPDRCIMNKCVYPDFRDLIRFGEYVEMTISDLRKETKGEWDEDMYKDVANKVAGISGQNKYNLHYSEYYSSESYSYSYDHEKIVVLKAMWYSTDTDVKKEYTNEVGNRRVKTMDFNYVPFKGDMKVNEGKGMSDMEYNELNKGKSRIYRTPIKNVYQCSWVVGTDHVYNHGLMKNMLRSASNWQDTVMPVTLISTDFVSTMSLIEQPLDQVQLNYLQFQSHVAASKPPGIAIEKHALARLAKGTVVKWDPKKALEMYAETGNLTYDGYDQHGTPLNQIPIMELKNGLSQGAADHFTLMLQFIDLIKGMLGLNVMTEGSTPPERLGKTVAEMSFGASDNALSHLVAAYKTVYEKTARNLFYLLQNNVMRMNPESISESLGSESYKYFMLNRDLGLRAMGIILEEGPDDAVREKVSVLLQLMVENKEIPGEDAIMIEMQKDNPYRQVLMIRKHRKEREASEAAKQEQLVRAQGEENTKTAMAVEQEAQKTKQMDMKGKEQEMTMKALIEKESDDRKFTYDMIIKKMDAQIEIEQSEKDLIADLLKTLIKAETDIKKQKISNQKPKATAKA